MFLSETNIISFHLTKIRVGQVQTTKKLICLHLRSKYLCYDSQKKKLKTPSQRLQNLTWLKQTLIFQKKLFYLLQ